MESNPALILYEYYKLHNIELDEDMVLEEAVYLEQLIKKEE